MSAPAPAAEPERRGDVALYGAVAAFVALWAFKLYVTWGAWGDLTVDTGHEMYVPTMLAQGKMLYRDIWFMYPPAAPYINSVLFRLFGAHLNVMYAAGAVSALLSSVLIFLAGRRFTSAMVAWSAGAVILIDGFEPSIFSFPLPYSFSAVYACLVGCLFLWLIVHAATESRGGWTVAAGMAAAVAALLKPEFGVACYVTLALLVASRAWVERSWSRFRADVVRTLPGVVLCLAVIGWMISIRGFEFITQENLVNWPTSHFMRTVGKTYLALSGFTLSPSAFLLAARRTIPLEAVTGAILCVVWWPHRWVKRLVVVSAVACAAMVGILVTMDASHLLGALSSELFFPPDMVLYVVIATAVAWVLFVRAQRVGRAPSPVVPLVFTFAGLVAFRLLMGMRAGSHAIYYNGPVVLAFLFLYAQLLSAPGRSRRWVRIAQGLVCVGCLATVEYRALGEEADARDNVPLVTTRGTIRVSPEMAENYTAAIRFMREKAAAGEQVLSLPEDTSLYFLSETECATRVYLTTPGVIAPGKMTDEYIREVERTPVRYLLWSNRRFPEYGVPEFGTDFNRELGDYFRSHYHPVGPLLPPSAEERAWTAVVWERNTATATR